MPEKPVKQQYVLVFALRVPCNIPQQVVLVERMKIDWQQGRLNLPGGHIEDGESPEQAAERELLEETGLECPFWDIKVLGVMEGDDWVAHVCFAPCREWKPVAEESQPIHTMNYREALADPRLISNLKLIIPLCMTRVTGWHMAPAGPCGWTINI